MRYTVATLVLLLLGVTAMPDQQTMSAIRIHGFGDRDLLKLEPTPRPAPGEGELLVRVHAAAVNPVDWKLRKSGGRGWMEIELPYIPGFDLSGVVESVGTGVMKFKRGDAVFAMLDLRRGGAYAEYAIVKESEAAAKPKSVSHIDAAAVPLVALTAWQALFDTADLQEGQTVLIHAGAGGVGSVAVQLAKWKGARVIATASQANHEFLEQLGVDQAIDYKTQSFVEIVKDVDVVLDSVGGQTTRDSLKVLRKGGMLVSIVGQPPQQLAKDAGVRATGILVEPRGEQLAQIAKLIDEGKLKPIVTHTFPLSDVAKAHEQSETGHTRGKIVLKVVAD